MGKGVLLSDKDIKRALSRVSGRLPYRLPCSTYRLQFNRDFRFADAIKVIPYLSELGITDIYSSPYFKAVSGSTHGYDVTDPATLNPEVGSEEEFASFAGELSRRGMGLIMDIVPNHMSIAGSENEWWRDVLENGPSSPYAGVFDIDWKPVKEELHDKVIMPVLGRQYGEALENQELSLSFKDGAFFVTYYDHSFPVDPSTYPLVLSHRIEDLGKVLGEEDADYQELLSIITALGHLPDRSETDSERITERLREKEIVKKRLLSLYESNRQFRESLDNNIVSFNGNREDTESFDILDELLSAQVYRLAYWQVATEEINYRRFFDINDLAAVRTEDPHVFQLTHSMVLRHIREGKITGLRVDHPDGLGNPAAYFRKLQMECLTKLCEAELGMDGKEPETAAVIDNIKGTVKEMLSSNRDLSRPFYITGEKILMESERIPGDWPIFGTTGYVFMNSVGGLQVEQANARTITGIYSRFIREKPDFARMVYEKKKLILESSMASEINVLGHSLNRISERDRHFRDFTLYSLIDALVETIAYFPVYRTYIDESGVSDRDARYISAAISKSKRHRRDLSASVFDFLEKVLTLRFPEKLGDESRGQWLDFTMKFQQLTGPVMAKGYEDTVFYHFNRLVSLNEVGGAPNRFGLSLEAFHGQNIEMSKHWPHTMLATSTHDSKRSEDVRARINVISEVPDEWQAALRRWSRLNRKIKSKADGRSAPDSNDEYLLYQTLLGAWPMQEDEGRTDEFSQRMKQYMIKAAREAKQKTSWLNPDSEYEEALMKFTEGVLRSEQFMEDFLPFQRKVSHFGIFNSLSQSLLKITSPGVPDFYQGTELWNLRLVDPDNRAPVDYARSLAMLAELKSLVSSSSAEEAARKLLDEKKSGMIKLFLVHKSLGFRRKHHELCTEGDYVPLYAAGKHGENIVAFVRAMGGEAALAAAPRLLTSMGGPTDIPTSAVWKDTYLPVPDEYSSRVFEDVFTGKKLRTAAREGRYVLDMEEVFALLPFALLEIKGTDE